MQIIQSCPNQRQATIWGALCMLRYSDAPIFRTMTVFPGFRSFLRGNTTSPPDLPRDFTLQLLLDNLRTQAANGGASIKVAAGDTTLSSGIAHVLLQCIPDISSEDCSSCLVNAQTRMFDCCAGLPWSTMCRPSCNLYYSLQPFYNISRIQELVVNVSTTSLSSPPESAPAPASTPPGNGHNSTTRIIIILFSAAGGLLLAVILGLILRKRKKHMAKEEEFEGEISIIQSLQFDFGKIRKATNDFSKASKLGQGGFGAVYRGKLSDGRDIAVKRLSGNSSQGDLEFKNEILFLARLQHRNLVRLLGFSMEGIEKLLVYEFLENASLDHYIFDPAKRSHFNWDTRYKIIKDIAQGLLYLHEGSRLRIIHHDLKPSNILLDGEMNPKIADFGMARLFAQEETQGNTSRIVGTFGYMAPEYASQGQVSVKLDVFSFGILVLEIISGQKNINCRNKKIVEDLLISRAWKTWHDGMAANLVDHFLCGGSDISPDIVRCIHISLLCVQENAEERPTMASVVLMLGSYNINLPIPLKPGYFVPSDDALEDSNTRDSHGTHNHVDPSVNTVTVTELDPR